MSQDLIYDPADDDAARFREHFPAHQAWLATFGARGDLVFTGPFDGSPTPTPAPARWPPSGPGWRPGSSPRATPTCGTG